MYVCMFLKHSLEGYPLTEQELQTHFNYRTKPAIKGYLAVVFILSVMHDSGRYLEKVHCS